MKIAVDIDDTLNIIDRVTRAGEYIKENGLPFTLVNSDTNYLAQIYSWEQEDVLNFLHAGGINIYADALLRDDAVEVLTSLRLAGHEIIILTARGTEWFGDPVAFSKAWLEKWKVPYDEIVACVTEKGTYCKEHGINILIDDYVENLRGAKECGILPILAVDKYNEQYLEEFPYAGRTWKEIGEVLKRAEEEI